MTRRVIHFVSGIFFAYLSLQWIAEFVAFAIRFPWNLEGIKLGMSHFADHGGYETWGEVKALHIFLLLLTGLVATVFYLTRRKAPTPLDSVGTDAVR